MQGLWTRAVSSASRSCRCYTCTNAGRNAVPARNAASRRRLLIGNGVTMFYSAIFATAAVLDASAKQRRRTELEKDIEVVKAEMQELQNEEARLLSQLAPRWKPCQARVRRQTRTFSTAIAPDTDSIGGRARETMQRATDAPHEAGSYPGRESAPSMFDADLGSANAIYAFDTVETDAPGLTGQPSRRRVLQYLSLKQLAIKLLLRPAVAHGYGGMKATYGRDCNTDVDANLRRMDIERMLDDLRRTHEKMNYIRSDENAQFHDVMPPITLEEHFRLIEEREGLEKELRHIVDVYMDGDMPLHVLILRIADNLVASKEPISPSALTLLISVFNDAKQKDIVTMIMDTLFPNGFLLTRHTIALSINYFGNTYNLHGFNKFLTLLQNPARSRFRATWATVRSGGVDIPVPPRPPHPFIMSSLIKASLNLDQPHRANAWLEYSRQCGLADNSMILTAYLRYYSMTRSWKDGIQYLYRAIKFLRSTGKHQKLDAERLILFMICLCHCCDKEESASVLANAAVSSGLESRRAHNDNDQFSGAVAALTQWEEMEWAAVGLPFDEPPKDKTEYYVFARKIEQHFSRELRQVREENLREKQLVESIANVEAAEENEEKIDYLRNEVADLKRELSAVTRGQRDRRIRESPPLAKKAAKSTPVDAANPKAEPIKPASSGGRKRRRYILRHHITNPIPDVKVNRPKNRGVNTIRVIR